MVKDLERVGMYFASTVDTSAARAKGLTAEPLIMTSEKSVLQERIYDVNPLRKWTLQEADRGTQVVAAIIQGRFTSAFAGQAIPSSGDSAAAPPDLNAPRADQSPETRVVVVGDGKFFEDQKGGGDRDNLLFFQNLIDWLAQDEALITIRSREVTDRPLKPVSEPTKRFVKYANMLGSPVLVVLFGLIVWQVRRRRTIDI
jgi:hypothetical protein